MAARGAQGQRARATYRRISEHIVETPIKTGESPDLVGESTKNLQKYNALMIERFISISGNPPNLRKNDTA